MSSGGGEVGWVLKGTRTNKLKIEIYATQIIKFNSSSDIQQGGNVR